MKKKLCLYLVIVLFLCGCNVKYDVTVNENFTMQEEIVITETESFFEHSISKDDIIEKTFQPYQNFIENAGYSAVDYRYKDESGKIFSRFFNNINDFVQGTIFYKHYWPQLTTYQNGNLITIKTTDNFIKIEEDDSDDQTSIDDWEDNPYFLVNNATITFTLPYKVVESTANSCTVVKNNYVCKWIINENTENLTFSLTFDKGIKVKDMTDVDLPNNIVDGVQPSIPKKNTVSNILIISGLLLLIVGLIVIIILIVRYKEKKDLEKQERGN
jgi:hypothetical protein